MAPVLIGIISLVFLLAPPAVAQSAPDQECLACHGEASMQNSAGKSIYIEGAKYAAGVHQSMGCLACHPGAKENPHPAKMDRPKCADCHADQVAANARSVHGRARRNGDQDAPACTSCHGPFHAIVRTSEPSSTVSKKNLPGTCGACHANPNFLARHKIPFARPLEAYQQSVHGRANQRGNEGAATCSDCHGSHTIVPGRDTASKINHYRVPETCGACHDEIKKTYLTSVHGQAAAKGVPGAPVCTDCHGEHNILAPKESASLVNKARVSAVTCGHCHADERLAARYNLPRDKVPAFEDSYHGLANRAGSQSVANCASCHGVHNILPSNDPNSMIHPAKLAGTCGTCHPGAGGRFTIGPVHVKAASADAHPSVRWIRWAYLLLIPLTLGGMLLHNALDFFSKLVRGGARFTGGRDEQVPRMNLHFRVAHWLVMLSFPVLVYTGFALKFPEAWWAEPVLYWESRWALRGTIHRSASVVLMFALVYHLVHLAISRRDRRVIVGLLPRLQDVRDFVGIIRYNLGLNDQRPQFGTFNYVEKSEYWAFMWGTVVMALSGFILWFNNFSLKYFPKWVSDAATAIHWYEAILASLAIFIWHMYFVMFDPDVYPMDKTWLTGKASGEHLKHTRYTYYLKATGRYNPAPEPAPADEPAVEVATAPAEDGDRIKS